MKEIKTIKVEEKVIFDYVTECSCKKTYKIRSLAIDHEIQCENGDLDNCLHNQNLSEGEQRHKHEFLKGVIGDTVQMCNYEWEKTNYEWVKTNKLLVQTDKLSLFKCPNGHSLTEPFISYIDDGDCCETNISGYEIKYYCEDEDCEFYGIEFEFDGYGW